MYHVVVNGGECLAPFLLLILLPLRQQLVQCVKKNGALQGPPNGRQNAHGLRVMGAPHALVRGYSIILCDVLNTTGAVKNNFILSLSSGIYV